VYGASSFRGAIGGLTSGGSYSPHAPLEPPLLQVPLFTGCFKTLLWLCMIVFMTVGLLFNIQGLAINYLSHPVSVQVSVQRQAQLVFPAVTICNMSPARSSAVKAEETKNASVTVANNGGNGNATLMAVVGGVVKRQKRNVGTPGRLFFCHVGFSSSRGENVTIMYIYCTVSVL